MKKILVFLLILAVGAGTVFAQDAEAGTFTWAGEFRFGADVNFAPEYPNDSDHPTLVGSNGYGQATLSYDKGPLNTELVFRTNKLLPTPSGYLLGFAEYGDGVNSTESNFKVAGKLKLLDSASPNGALSFETLYGYYYFLDRQLKLDIAYHGYETIYWRASDVVAQAWDNLDGKPGVVLNYKPAFLSGLSVGAMLPRLDNTATATGASQEVDNYFRQTVFGAKYDIPDVLAVSTMVKLAPYDTKAERAQLGFKYTVIPSTLTVKADATAFNLGDFGKTGIINAGLNAEYAAAPLTAGLTLKLAGTPGAYKDAVNAGLTEARRKYIAAQKKAVDDAMEAWDLANPTGYDSTNNKTRDEYITDTWLNPTGGPTFGPRFANLDEYYAFGAPNGPPPASTDPYYYPAEGIGIGSDNKDTEAAFFYLNPYVYYNLIPDTLQVRLPVTLAFGIGDAAKDQKFLLLEPGLYWSMKGAADTNDPDDPATGLLIKYSLGYDLEGENDVTNKLSINFRWNF